MNRSHIVALAAVVIAIPLGGQAVFAPAAKPCLNTGNTSFQLSSSFDAGTRVRIADDATPSDLRVSFVDSPDRADFILVDDAGEPENCPAARRRTVNVGHGVAKADISVGIVQDAADYRIYLNSTRYSREDAAGLFAAIWRADHKAKLATR
ncbi:MAG TPA: hypothetical protein VFB45_00385 [Pseudolabrys sp.]|nr:hypothetical protein [Pseudolabrys sp.]